MSEHTSLVHESLSADAQTEFDDRVKEQATRLKAAHEQGSLDSPTFGIGFELETYMVAEDHSLTYVPGPVYDEDCDKELGLHNIEFQTDATTFDEAGIENQARQLQERLAAVREAAAEDDVTVPLDAMWAVPPTQGSYEYLSDTLERDGVTIARNMTPSPRYYAIDNHIINQAGGSVTFSVPGATVEFPTILMESLTTSIQPHLQVPASAFYPRYHNLALRTLGPVLAISTNSPLLPLDLYDDDADPATIVEETYHELRIEAFEQSINEAWEKVKFPADVDTVADVLDHLEADYTCAPFLREWVEDDERETFHDQNWELDHKRGTFWRWLRAVIGGQPVGGGTEESIRMEYRPIPTQPTVKDNIAVQCLVSGLVRGLVVTDHPIGDLSHAAAEDSFYQAVQHGIEADLEWITADGDRTTDYATIYEDIFSVARAGLRAQDISTDTIDEYLGLLEARVEREITPSQWKLNRVQEGLDGGMSFADAVEAMQSQYNRQCLATESFIEWLPEQ